MENFFVTSAQIIVALLLALTIQYIRPSALSISSLDRSLRTYTDMMIFIWGSLGLITCLNYIGKLIPHFQDGGKFFVTATIIVLLAYILIATIKQANRYTLFVLAFFSMSLPIFASNIFYAMPKSLVDMVMFSIIPLPAMIGFIKLMKRQDFKDISREVIGLKKKG